MIILDIETRPREDLVERYIKPLEAFNPDAVKYGNTKDAGKRAALLDSKKAEHDDASALHLTKAKAKAALDPLTAEIVVIGVNGSESSPCEGEFFFEGTEEEILTEFWDLWRSGESTKDEMISWSGNASSDCFDPMMILRRSWMLDIKTPSQVVNGRYLGNRWVDASSRYLVGKYGSYCSLTRAADELGLFLGTDELRLSRKSDNDIVTGKDFHLWYDGKVPNLNDSHASTAEHQRALALSYLSNDLRLLQGIVDRIY